MKYLYIRKNLYFYCIFLFASLLTGGIEAKADDTNNVISGKLNISLSSVETPNFVDEFSYYLDSKNDVFTDQNQVTPNNNPIHLVIKLKDRQVYVYQNNQLLNTYPIAIGKKGWETPTGNFQVMQMVENPFWQHPLNGKIIPPGKENPLGDRWIAFWTDGKNYIGFHGTPNEKLVGQAVSHGCIRMRNQDVRDLFTQVSIGTPISVQP